jgi:hypothetical protein
MNSFLLFLKTTVVVALSFAFQTFFIVETAEARIKVEIVRDAAIRFPLVFINGLFEYGDDKPFLENVMPLTNGIVVLNSPGGNVIAAIEIGKIIRLKGFNTVVLNDDLCASACALTWLAGNERFLDSGASVGFHASYIHENGRNLETGLGNALVGRYLTQLNLPEAAVVFVTSAPPEGMNWLTSKNANQAGISVKLLTPQNDAKDINKSSPTFEQDDPLTTASKFYSYLSRADGVGAAALVIPEKRGKGPFNETNIANFFGSLKKPLRVVRISNVSPSQIAVSYEYQKSDGTECRATANVFTTFAYGRTLIERISAKC